MFDSFSTQRRSIFDNKLFLGCVAVAALGTSVSGGAAVVNSMWQIEYTQIPQIESKGYQVALAAVAPPPPASKAKTVTTKQVVENVQMIERKDDESVDEDAPPVQEEGGEEGGVEGGIAGGQIGGTVGGSVDGVLGGSIGGAAPIKKKDNIMAPKLFRKQKISGEQPKPDRPDQLAIQRAGSAKVVGTWKICVTKTGKVKSVKRRKSTGYSAYDRKLESAMRKWKYKPMKIDGRPADVCGNTTVIYRISKTGI